MPDILYHTGAGELAGGGIPIAYLTDAIKAMLLDDSYAEDADDDVVQSGAGDPATAEVSGSGYADGYGGAGRQALASKTITIAKANGRTEFDAADITWEAIDVGSIAALALVLEDHVGVTGDDTETRLIAFHDSGFPVLTNGGNFTLQTPNDVLRFSSAAA